MKELFTSDYVDLSYDEKFKVIMTVWKAHAFSGDQYRDIWERTLDFGNKNDVKYFLSDIINQKVVAPVDRKWFEEVAVPRALKTGIIKGGIILGSNPFKRYYFNNIMRKIGGLKFPFKAFKDKEGAIEWFLSDKMK